jgi:hypothetical protein
MVRLFGLSWKTSASAVVTAIAGFIAFSPELFSRWPIVLQISKYVALGGLASLGISAADKKQ